MINVGEAISRSEQIVQPDIYTLNPSEAIFPLKKQNIRLPHPIPYQGSKRSLAPQILALVKGKYFSTFYEPFAGSAAFTIAATNSKIAHNYVLSDSLQPLIDIWYQILSSPHALANAYEELWYGQMQSDHNYYYRVRDEYNLSHEPAPLLYLLARCVKNAPRFNQLGEFNQSYDKRRLGMHPDKMRNEILTASFLLAGHTRTLCADFESAIASATPDDIVYLDPPYEGTTTSSNKRYHQGLSRERLIAALENLKQREVPFILSYDGRCGNKTYGEILPASLNLTRFELNAGRSSQSTLNGNADITVESLYVSNVLV